MTRQTALSSARALLTFLGTFLIGHAIAGHTVTADLWTMIGGAALTVISTVWSFTDKSTTPEAIQTGVRQAFVAIGGVTVAFGWVNQNTLNSILGLLSAILPVIQSTQAKVSAKQVASGAAAVTDQGKIVKAAPKVSMVAVLVLAALFAHAQSPFKPLAKLPTPNKFARDVFNPDSTLQAWRFVANIAAYSYPGNIAEAGVGYGYQWLKWDETTSKWYCNESISAVAFAGGSVAPSTPSSIVSAALMLGLDNNLFLVGPQYNFGTKQFGVAVSIGINLNN